MRKINKREEPCDLREWKRHHPRGRYNDLPAPERQVIRASCISEQFGLCAYCCRDITVDSAHNEHLQAQRLAQNNTVDFNNIVASCNTRNQCGEAHKHDILPLTPLMDECETELKFYLSGRAEGVTQRARDTIRVLNLGDTPQHNRALIERRKQMVDNLIYEHGENPDNIQLLEGEDELLEILIDDLQRPDNNYQLQPFAPVLVNILRHWLAA